MNPTQRTQLERGVVLWNEGRFFEAHDAWEEAWRAASGEEKTLFQGLIQAAAALVKWQRNEARGAFRLLTAAIDKLYGIEESAGVAVDPLIDALAALRTEAEKAVAASPTAADLPADIAFPRLGYSPPDAAAESLGGLSVFPRARCPYCGEEVEVAVEALGASSESFVQDCSVCCRPWTVHVTREGGEVDVSLQRDDE